jgi:hypothetical protein
MRPASENLSRERGEAVAVQWNGKVGLDMMEPAATCIHESVVFG